MFLIFTNIPPSYKHIFTCSALESQRLFHFLLSPATPLAPPTHTQQSRISPSIKRHKCQFFSKCLIAYHDVQNSVFRTRFDQEMTPRSSRNGPTDIRHATLTAQDHSNTIPSSTPWNYSIVLSVFRQTRQNVLEYVDIYDYQFVSEKFEHEYCALSDNYQQISCSALRNTSELHPPPD